MADDVGFALHDIYQANNVFTFDLYKGLATQPGNLFFSPLSIQVILALTYLGARGNTAKQLARGLSLPENKDVVEYGVGVIINRLQNSNDVSLDMANRIFLKTGFDIKERFYQSAARFKAGVEGVDFQQEEQARKTINNWVEYKTNNKIKDIISPGILNSLTRMVLVNAIYFKGTWLKSFEKDQTSRLPFLSASRTNNNVDMMFITETFMYAESKDLNSQILLLPYKGKKINMMIFLPREANGLANLEEKFGSFNLQETINSMYETLLKVYLPRFKLEYSKELKTTLKWLGVTDAFTDENANFTGISDNRLKVDKVLHKAFVEVNEEGTEAAAATAVIQSPVLSFDPPPLHPLIFKADHPFAFLILDQQTKTVLFAGRYSDPASTF